MVDILVAEALSAFNSWSKITPPTRGRLLSKIAEQMDKERYKFIKLLMDETGKTKEQAEGEVRSAYDACVFFAGEGRRLYGDTTTSELPNRWAMTKRYPIGVVGIITPWNFPLSLMAWKTFPALICGNTVILKASKETQKTARLFASILEANLPHGVFNLTEDGKALVRNKHVRLISFTGSTKVGKEIAEICGKRLAKCSLELGGKNCAIVLEDADLDLAASCVANGAYSFAGQRCASTSRVIVHERVYVEFLALLQNEARKYDEKPKKTNNYPKIIETTPDDDICQRELFAPVLAVLKAKSFEEAIYIHNSTEYGLTGAVFTKDINKALRAIDEMECGVIYCNSPTYGSECHLSFGGCKNSGNGMREVGMAAIEIFSQIKSVYLDYSGNLQNAQFKR